MVPVYHIDVFEILDRGFVYGIGTVRAIVHGHSIVDLQRIFSGKETPAVVAVIAAVAIAAAATAFGTAFAVGTHDPVNIISCHRGG